MKVHYLGCCATLTYLISTFCSAASFQTKDFTLQLPGDWHASTVQESDSANAYQFRRTGSAAVVLILVTKTWLGSKQDDAIQLEHAKSLATACLKSQFEDPPSGPVELSRCEIAGTNGFCTNYLVHPKGTNGVEGVCMGWPGGGGLVYTANWSDTVPVADSSRAKILTALKSIELPKMPDRGAVAPAKSHRSALSGGKSPEMVILPAGRFQMGSPSVEGSHNDDEGPMHEVSVRSFALGKYPVTRGQFATFVNATGYRTDAEKESKVNGKAASGCIVYQRGRKSFHYKAGTSWRDPNFAQDDTHPAVCLSWNDAQAFVGWLALETGKRYRLPTEAEMEYAIRAGSATAYPWGSEVEQACSYDNVADAALKVQNPEWPYPTVSCNDGAVYTTPIGHYGANSFGLFDTVGNVVAWTQDCYTNDYDGAPSDGSARATTGCELRVLRGSSWHSYPAIIRSAFRFAFPTASMSNYTGLRVAQDL